MIHDDGVRKREALHCLRLAALVLLALATAGEAARAQQQPVPELTGRVADRADILSDQTERALASLLAAHEDSTSNQVAVLTVSSLEGEPIEDFALRVARTWGLGTSEFDNGVLLVVAVEDRRMRIEVGYGLEGVLPDVVADRIIRHEMRTAFRKGDYDTGVMKGVQAILGTIEGTYTLPAAASSGGSDEVPPPFMRLMFALMFVLMPLTLMAPSFLIAGRWGGLFFVSIFVIVGCGIAFFSLWGLVGGAVGYWLFVFVAEQAFRRQDDWREERRQVREALVENKGRRVKVDLGGFTYTAGGITSGKGSGSSSGGGFSSGGGGGGFSGGGGTFGGGGASGSW